ncbi:site-2 protease family protein [Achromobacter sp. GG226]|uniref:site-2 protease family protein n=1 Tax=Verticiella alkaliphila TaxID=2779529 RepID=UPI001C0BC598|nr:site-2 protease family protein [Verticiella sp. GG226]MBU4610260.1 site-2 protease family protein [Verticiella sp. GG226]
MSLLIAVVLCVFLHTFSMALAGVAMGVTLREVSIGFGPTLFRAGRLRVRLLPLGGSVQFKDSQVAAQERRAAAAWARDALDEKESHLEKPDIEVPVLEASDSGEPEDGALVLEASDLEGALDQRHAIVQGLIGLAGCAALVMLAVAIWQGAGLHAVVAGFGQIVAGAISPLDEAQGLIAQAEQALVGLPLLGVLGWVAAKLAAFNLLPLPAANGGFVLAALGRALGIQRYWPSGLTMLLLFVYVAIAMSWLVAFGSYWLS